MLEACKYRTSGLEDFMSHQLNAAPAEMHINVDEAIYVCEREMQREAFQMRYAGTEDHKQLVTMIEQLKKTYRHSDPVKLKTTNALNVF